MLAEEVKKIDSQLYEARYIDCNREETLKIWDSIKTNNEVLKIATTVVRDRFDEGDTVIGLAICDAMLIDYDSIDKGIYQKLVNKIYSNTDIARTVIDGAANGGLSYLLMTLWNQKLKLTPEQKQFAVCEAMNKIGTKKYYQEQENYRQKLLSKGVTDDNVSVIDIDGSVNPIGQLSGSMYLTSVFCSLDDSQAHGMGVFDIRYHILKNNNFSLEEKRQLVYDFYASGDDTWDEVLEQFEWGIINDNVNFKNTELSIMDIDFLYDYSKNDLIKMYGNREDAQKIFDEIQFCHLMHQIRPQQWEIKNANDEVKVLKSNK